MTSRQPNSTQTSAKARSSTASSGTRPPSDSSPKGHSDRERFGATELAIVLSHYDLGIIETVREFNRGSRKSPKLVIRTERGTCLLKRRAIGRNDPSKVAFAHELQLFLAKRKFPLPQLVGTRGDNNSMVRWNNAIYELFAYTKGSNYDSSLDETAESGKVLAQFHKLLRDCQTDNKPSTGSYHAADTVETSMTIIPRALAKADPRRHQQEPQISELLKSLQTTYDEAVRQVASLGFDAWPTQIVHCDWHPGNMLFRSSRIVAVIDYDSARILQRVLDIANGALQFSIIGGTDNPDQWPDHVDASRLKCFLQAYESVPDSRLTRAEIRSIPWLMIEALIAESVIPIANTGSFARIEGLGFLRMVKRKTDWIQEHAGMLTTRLES